MAATYTEKLWEVMNVKTFRGHATMLSPEQKHWTIIGSALDEIVDKKNQLLDKYNQLLTEQVKTNQLLAKLVPKEVEQIKKVSPNVPNKDNNSYTQQLLERAEKNINDRRNLH